METGSDFGIPGWFIALFVLIALVGIGTTVWRMVAARNMARDAGLDAKRAAQVTLLSEDGLGAAYLASALNSRAPEPAHLPKTVEQRLHELDSLRSRSLVSEAEYAAQRQRILDSV